MSVNYYYNFASILISTGECIEVFTTTRDESNSAPDGEMYIAIPVYDEEYISKYYIDGNWYEDSEGLIPWESSLL